MASAELINEVNNVLEIYENIIGRRATGARQMIDTYGHINGLSRLVVSSKLQQGFKKLWDQNQLNNTFEAVVTHFPIEFRSEVVAAAQFRLDKPFE